MNTSIFGQVVGVRKFVNGDIELDFYHNDEITEYRYSINSSLPENLSKELVETMASTLGTNVCIEVCFGEDGNLTHIELEECEDEFIDDEDYDEDNMEEL